MFVCVAWQQQSYQNEPYPKLWMRIFYIFIALELNCVEMYSSYMEIYVYFIYITYILCIFVNPLVMHTLF